MINKKYIFEKLNAEIKNPIGVYALMGNLKAESNFNPKNLQNSYEKKLGYNDETYTKAVDSGKHNFVRDSAGYGLAQWTYWSRKDALLRYAKSLGKSIGDLDMQLAYLLKELRGYRTVWTAVTTGTSLKEISDIVMCQFERPADQSANAKSKRASYGEAIKAELEGIVEDSDSKHTEVNNDCDMPTNSLVAPQEPAVKKTNKEIAQEVIKGLWGNGNERKIRLKEAGYNYATVQRLVNQMLK